ncbi:MAG: transposase [Sphingobacteriales bacterium]|nr:transposase [Sphingobacteriales bacterium]
MSYLILDSAYGNSKYLQLAKEKGLCVISELRQSPALFFLPDTPQNDTDTPNKKRGRPQKYGRKVDIKTCPIHSSSPKKQKTAYTTPSINFRHTIKKCLRFCST